MIAARHNHQEFAPGQLPPHVAIGRRGSSLLVPATTSLDHAQRDSHSLLGARTPGAWRCCGYLPGRVSLGARGLLPKAHTGRGQTIAPGAFFGIGRRSRACVANHIYPSDHTLYRPADLLKRHFKTSDCELPQANDGVSQGVGHIIQGRGND